MNRELTLQIVSAIVGVLFLALMYLPVLFFHQDPELSVMLSVYVTFGVLLLLAIRNASANRY